MMVMWLFRSSQGSPTSKASMGFMETDLDLHCLQPFLAAVFMYLFIVIMRNARWICHMTIANATVDTPYALTINFILPCRQMIPTYTEVIVTEGLTSLSPTFGHFCDTM